MLEHGLFLWSRKHLPDPAQVVSVCNRYGVKRVLFKFLDGTVQYNIQGGETGRVAYVNALKDGGLIVEGWGYHYPLKTVDGVIIESTRPGPQGDAIQAIQEKYKLETYHLNAEVEWEQVVVGGGAMMETMLSKPKKSGFELLTCSFRFPTLHPKFPWGKCNNAESMDGWSPQIYWALTTNPVQQLERTIEEYSKISSKVIYPVGPLFGDSFGNVYWEPRLEDIVKFREAVEARGMKRVYWWSLDWIIQNNRYDMLKAATGIDNGSQPPPPPPPIENPEWAEILVDGLSMRSEPIYSTLTLAGKGIKGRKVKLINQPAQNGYVPCVVWVWEKSIRKV